MKRKQVKIKDNNGKGKIEISYFSHDEFDRITEILKNNWMIVKKWNQ